MTSPVRGLNDPVPETGAGEPEGRDDSGRVEPFPSVEALRSRHAELAKRLRNHRAEAALWVAVREFIGRTRATGAVLDACDDRSVAQAILNYWSSALYRNCKEDIDAVLAPYAEPEPERDLEVLNRCPCPYPGLAPFDEGNREDFLGRWRCVQEAVGLLTKHHFLAVVGPTGRGKTSLVRAGLLPALREGAADGPGWRVLAPVEPGPDLLGRLVRAVRPGLAADAEWVEQQAAAVRHDAGHLARLARWPSEPPVVLTVDPFEDVFASANVQELRAFVRALAALATDSPPHSVILVVRWEDTPRVVHFRQLTALFEASQLLVEPPSVEELREMIEGPARRVGLRFEAGIVNKLIRDVNGDPWTLALLQFALVKLWEGRPRDSVAITWDVYNQTLGEGGARGALLANATRFYEHDLTEHERAVARKVLVRLVHTGAGRELVLTRVPLADLSEPEPALPLPGKAGRLARELLDEVLLPSRPEPEGAPRRGGGVAPEEVVAKLRGAKLVRVRPGDDGRPDVELANEAILDKWPALAGWVYEAHREADLAAERLRMRVASCVAVFMVLLLAALVLLFKDYQSVKKMGFIRLKRAGG